MRAKQRVLKIRSNIREAVRWKYRAMRAELRGKVWSNIREALWKCKAMLSFIWLKYSCTELNVTSSFLNLALDCHKCQRKFDKLWCVTYNDKSDTILSKRWDGSKDSDQNDQDADGD